MLNACRLETTGRVHTGRAWTATLGFARALGRFRLQLPRVRRKHSLLLLQRRCTQQQLALHTRARAFSARHHQPNLARATNHSAAPAPWIWHTVLGASKSAASNTPFADQCRRAAAQTALATIRTSGFAPAHGSRPARRRPGWQRSRRALHQWLLHRFLHRLHRRHQ